MISEGACDCDYGRKQIASSCNIEPMFIKCPSELKEKDLEIVSKFKYLNKIIRNCRKDKEEIKRRPYFLYSIIGILSFVIAILFFKKQ